jgi:hypothetical protein
MTPAPVNVGVTFSSVTNQRQNAAIAVQSDHSKHHHHCLPFEYLRLSDDCCEMALAVSFVPFWAMSLADEAFGAQQLTT